MNDENVLVGIGSLGLSRWEYPAINSPRKQINIIPMVGVDIRFWGQPPGPREDRYSWQILDQLRLEAMRHTERLPVLGLFVNPENQRAIHFYEQYGFTFYEKTYDRNRSMLLDGLDR